MILGDDYGQESWRNQLSGPSMADANARISEPSWHDKYIKSWGSAALAQQEPNWFGKNVLGNIGKMSEGLPPGVGDVILAGLMGPRAPVRIPNPIKAYHGSPHDFDRFDLSKIGTGEGSQVFGRGLYFAEHEPVAKSYRDGLAGDQGQARVGGLPYDDLNPVHLATRTSYEEGGPERARALFDRRIAELRTDPDQGLVQRMMRAQHALQSDLPLYEGGGRMYEVNLHAKPERFLDWDRPIDQQSVAVNSAFDNLRSSAASRPLPTARRHLEIERGLPIDTPMSARFYAMENALGEKNVARVMGESGIPGIRYLDGGSRDLAAIKTQLAEAEKDLHLYQGWANVGPMTESLQKLLTSKTERVADLSRRIETPTSNYVVWTPEIIDIVRKYGLAGAVIGGGVSGVGYANGFSAHDPLDPNPYWRRSP